MANQDVTILIPNYKTLELTKLCLRLLRKHTDPALAKVIVIDNDSKDASLDYLRQLTWIELIERKAIPGESAVVSHSRALDLGLTRVTTPYVLSIHTDTLMKNNQWLPFLLSQIKQDKNIAGVGSWKLEVKPLWSKFLKELERKFQQIFFGTDKVGYSTLPNHHYLRSHCALYRMDLIKNYNLSFCDTDEVAGKSLHKKLVAQNFEMRFLASSVLLNYMEHVNHATTVLNPELSRHKKSVIKGLRRVQNSLKKFNAEEILKDVALDN